jgi:hypothetical protein
MLRHEVDDPSNMRQVKWIGGDAQRIGPFLHHMSIGGIGTSLLIFLGGGLPFPSLLTRNRTFLWFPSLRRCSPVTL